MSSSWQSLKTGMFSWRLSLISRFFCMQSFSIQNTVVQSIELQINRGGTGKSQQNSRGTGIAKLASAVPLIKAPL